MTAQTLTGLGCHFLWVGTTALQIGTLKYSGDSCVWGVFDSLDSRYETLNVGRIKIYREDAFDPPPVECDQNTLRRVKLPSPIIQQHGKCGVSLTGLIN